MATEQSPRRGPLDDLRVLEMGQLIAGPFCGQMFADFGAEVIKIEPPGVGDPMRQWGRERPKGKSLWWAVLARNKKSLTLDLRQPEGQEIVRELVKTTDVLIENFRPGTLERWNLSYEELSKINPRLILVRVSGYGQDGPYSKRAGYGAIGEAMGGMRYVVGDPSLPPSRSGISIGDELAALFAYQGALAALHERHRSGKGQVVDSAIYEAVLAMMESLVTEYDVTGYKRERTGAILPNIAPSNVYPTQNDGYLLIAANQDTVFTRLAEAMGRPELAQDPRYSTHTARGERQAELDSLIADWSIGYTKEALEALLIEAGVPCGPIYTAEDMVADPHFQAREAILQMPHPDFGAVRMQNVFPKLSATPGRIHEVGRDLGADTDTVLRGILGRSEAQIEALKSKGVV